MTVVTSGQVVNVSSATSGFVVLSGGEVNVRNHGVTSGTQLSGNGALEAVFSGGSADASVLMNGAQEQVFSGGTVSGSDLQSGAFAFVSSGGTANGVTVESGAGMSVGFGANVSGTQVQSGGLITELIVSSAVAVPGVIDGVTLESGAIASIRVLANGSISSFVVSDGGVDTVASGRTVDTVVSNGGSEVVFAGVVSGTVVMSGGGEQVVGGVASGTVLSSGGFAEIVGGTVSSMEILSGGSALVLGGVTTNTVVLGGGFEQVSGGVVSNTTVSSGGLEVVSGSGVADMTFVSSGGNMIVDKGGSASGTTIGSGGLEIVSAAGSASNTVIQSGGFEVVSGFADVSGTIVDNGGGISLNLSSSITFNLSGPTVVDGVTLESGAATDFSFASGAVISGFVAVSGSNETVGNGAVTIGTVLQNGGSETVSSGGSASGTVIGSGGVLIIASGGVASGTVLDSGGTIDLGGVTGTSASFSGGVLTITSGNTIVDQLTLSGNYNGDIFAVSGDGSGGTDVFITSAPPPLMPVISAPASATVAEGSATTINSVSISEDNLPDGQTFTVVLTDTSGHLSASGASGNGTTSLVVSGTLSEVNSALASLRDTDNVSGSDTITITATDHSGGTATPEQITVSASSTPIPVISSPASATVTQNSASLISGVVLSETNPIDNQTFTVTLTDAHGDLSASGASGNGTTSIVVSGSLLAVNSALATLSDDDTSTSADSITVSAMDGSHTSATTQHIGVSVTPTGGPTITVPLVSPKIPMAKATTITGLSIAEAHAVKNETFTVTLTDSHGALSAGGGRAVSGIHTTSITIHGTLAQVNADLKTVTDTDGVTPSDVLTITAIDSLSSGGAPTDLSITVKPAAPVISLPAPVAVGIGKPSPVATIAVSEAGNFNLETFTVTLTDKHGDLSASGATGNGTTKLTISGSLSTVNTELASLQDTDSLAAADTLTVHTADSAGGSVQKTLAIKVNGLPTFTAPATATLTSGVQKALSGVRLAETGTTTHETFSVTVTDANGLLFTSGTGVSGSGTSSVTVAGTLAQVNAALAKLQDDDSTTGGESITLAATDSFGNVGQKLIAVTVNAPPQGTAVPIHGAALLHGTASTTFLQADPSQATPTPGSLLSVGAVQLADDLTGAAALTWQTIDRGAAGAAATDPTHGTAHAGVPDQQIGGHQTVIVPHH